MKKVFKYPMSRRLKKFPIVLPRSFKFLRVSFQEEQLMMWAEVNPDEAKITIEFQVYGTGHEIPDGQKYLTTYDDGPFVFHVYQVTPTDGPYVSGKP